MAIAEEKIMQLSLDEQNAVAILALVKNEDIVLQIRMAGAAYLKTMLSRIYNVSMSLLIVLGI